MTNSPPFIQLAWFRIQTLLAKRTIGWCREQSGVGENNRLAKRPIAWRREHSACIENTRLAWRTIGWRIQWLAKRTLGLHREQSAGVYNGWRIWGRGWRYGWELVKAGRLLSLQLFEKNSRWPLSPSPLLLLLLFSLSAAVSIVLENNRSIVSIVR